ncbi:MAG: Gfo/Idh/MocA family oxidoreductase [Desulfobulbaceae bacterium]|nr:Gfo/Idh/MocA family oxidoreductase [Desulfobulbaceae bacterium]
MKKIKVAIIGTGKHGSRYAGHIVQDMSEMELTGISRRSSEGKKQAKEWNTRYFPDWQEMVSDPDVDAVISVTPPSLNLEIAERCCEAGKNLLIEKPLAINSKSAEKIIHLFQNSGLYLTVGHTLRYNSVLQALKKYLPMTGDLYAITASQRLEPSTLGWHEDPAQAGGGVVLQTAVHLFDGIRFITGHEFGKIRAATYRNHNAILEDLFTAQFEMNNHVAGIIEASKVGRGRSARYEFIGSKGQLHGDHVHGSLEFISGTKIKKIEIDPPGATIVPLLVDWLNYLRNAGENPIPAKEGLAAVRICESCYRSVQSGNWAKID